MTIDVTTLTAGRGLDRLIAEKVMGYDASNLVRMPVPVVESLLFRSDWHFPNGTRLPAYSTDIAAAWEVVEAMQTKGWCWTVVSFGRQVRVKFHNSVLAHDDMSETVPLATCRAAIRAVEYYA